MINLKTTQRDYDRLKRHVEDEGFFVDPNDGRLLNTAGEYLGIRFEIIVERFGRRTKRTYYFHIDHLTLISVLGPA